MYFCSEGLLLLIFTLPHFCWALSAYVKPLNQLKCSRSFLLLWQDSNTRVSSNLSWTTCFNRHEFFIKWGNSHLWASICTLFGSLKRSTYNPTRGRGSIKSLSSFKFNTLHLLVRKVDSGDVICDDIANLREDTHFTNTSWLFFHTYFYIFLSMLYCVTIEICFKFTKDSWMRWKSTQQGLQHQEAETSSEDGAPSAREGIGAEDEQGLQGSGIRPPAGAVLGTGLPSSGACRRKCGEVFDTTAKSRVKIFIQQIILSHHQFWILMKWPKQCFSVGYWQDSGQAGQRPNDQEDGRAHSSTEESLRMTLQRNIWEKWKSLG